MNTSDALTQVTRRKIDDFETPFTLENAKQAIFTFQGDAFQPIDADHYETADLQYAQRHLFILSGLYGALRPLDLMQSYRLEMGCRLETEYGKNLYGFWGDEISELLAKTLDSDNDKTLINLASEEYAKVIDFGKLPGRTVTIVFQQMSKGGYKTIAIHTKRARGLMVHFAITKKVESAENLKSFNLEGYQFVVKESTRNRWLFQQEK